MNGNKMNGMNGCGCGNQMNRPNNGCGCSNQMNRPSNAPVHCRFSPLRD